jgi:hypothetical protein
LAFALFAIATAARGQDDGPRVYLLAPQGAQNVTAFAVVKRGNEEPEVGTIVPGADIDTDILVLRYAGTFSLGGRQFNPFVILPTGEATTTRSDPSGHRVSESSGGLGDIQIGAVLGLINSPALAPADYAALKPGFNTGLFAKVYLPTGAYSSAQLVNLGSNRFAVQLGLPTTYAIGASYRDPSLTTIEVFPTVTFYAANDAPFGATRSTKDPLFTVEGHLTHNFSRTVWFSADVLYRQGGETTTDGVRDGNGTHGWSAGATAAVPLGGIGALILTYEKVIERSDNGPDGWFFRTAVVAPF